MQPIIKLQLRRESVIYLQHAASDVETGWELVVSRKVDDHLVLLVGLELGRSAEEADRDEGVVDVGQEVVLGPHVLVGELDVLVEDVYLQGQVGAAFLAAARTRYQPGSKSFETNYVATHVFSAY